MKHFCLAIDHLTSDSKSKFKLCDLETEDEEEARNIMNEDVAENFTTEILLNEQDIEALKEVLK